MRWIRLAVVAVTTVACASTPRKPTAAELAAMRATAGARVLDGCYDCLLEARAIYEQLAAGPARPSLAVPLFEVALLITLREKELAMDFSASFEHAQALARELPSGVDGARYLAVVDAVPPDATGVPQSEDHAFRRARQPYVPRINAEIEWLGAGPLRPAVREYLSISIDCKYSIRARGAGLPRPSERGVPPDAPPLLAYRLATCDEIKPAVLETVAARVPRFVEASYFRARLAVALTQQTGGAAARPLLAEAYGRFPQASAVTYLNANFQQLVGDCGQALRYYDETLALRPLHENSLLGRTVCLTFLRRHDEAIAAATRMIELRTFNMDEAYYWRAWIHHHRKALPAARADIERAKAMASSSAIHRLAGMIEHDQDDLQSAEKDLVAAKAAYGGRKDCVARWYLGLVGMKKSQWPETAAHFEDAMECYDRIALETEEGLRAMEANTDVDPEFKARQVEGFKIAIQEDRSQYCAAAFNAANHYARAGNLDKARALVEIAAKDPALEQLVKDLRRIIGG
jgi:tetratricopeptide (TPR) repeat protein